MTVGWVPHYNGSRGFHCGDQDQGCDTASRGRAQFETACPSSFIVVFPGNYKMATTASFRIHPYARVLVHLAEYRICLLEEASINKSRRKSVIFGWAVVFTLYCWSKA